MTSHTQCGCGRGRVTNTKRDARTVNFGTIDLFDLCRDCVQEVEVLEDEFHERPCGECGELFDSRRKHTCPKDVFDF